MVLSLDFATNSVVSSVGWAVPWLHIRKCLIPRREGSHFSASRHFTAFTLLISDVLCRSMLLSLQRWLTGLDGGSMLNSCPNVRAVLCGAKFRRSCSEAGTRHPPVSACLNIFSASAVFERDCRVSGRRMPCTVLVDITLLWLLSGRVKSVVVARLIDSEIARKLKGRRNWRMSIKEKHVRPPIPDLQAEVIHEIVWWQYQ